MLIFAYCVTIFTLFNLNMRFYFMTLFNEINELPAHPPPFINILNLSLSLSISLSELNVKKKTRLQSSVWEANLILFYFPLGKITLQWVFVIYIKVWGAIRYIFFFDKLLLLKGSHVYYLLIGLCNRRCNSISLLFCWIFSFIHHEKIEWLYNVKLVSSSVSLCCSHCYLLAWSTNLTIVFALNFLNMIFLATNYHEGKKKNPNDWALKFEHFHL